MNDTISDSQFFAPAIALFALTALCTLALVLKRSQQPNKPLIVATILMWLGTILLVELGTENYQGRPIYITFKVVLNLVAAGLVYRRVTRPRDPPQKRHILTPLGD